MERPVTVTVTCWVVIALAIEGLFTILSGIARTTTNEILHSISSPAPYSWIVVFGVALLVLTIVLSLLMLRGFNWARIAYLGLLSVAFFIPLASISQVSLVLVVLPLAKLLVFGTLLLSSHANTFFMTGRAKVVA